MQVCEFPRWAFLDSCRSEMRLELAGVGGGHQEERPLCGLRSGHQGTGRLRILASLPWGRLPAQGPVTDRTPPRTVSWSLSLRSVPEL